MLYPKFIDNNTPVQMVYITNSSDGGDGIIANTDIANIEGLAGKKIAVPRFSEAQTLVEWLIRNSSLTDQQQTDIRNAMVMFDTPDDAAKAFFAGQVDAAATWEPYLTEAQETIGAKVLFSTKSATKLILDGIIFTQDFAQANPDTISKFIDGALQASGMYTADFKAIKDFPLFSTEDDSSIADICTTALLTNFADNKDYLSGSAQDLYTQMCTIWASVDDESGNPLKTLPDKVNDAFDNSYLMTLSSEYITQTQQVQTFDTSSQQKAQSMDDSQALLKQTLTVNFQSNVAIITPDSFDALNKFAETAKTLDGAIIQIEGNIADTGEGDTESGRALSLQRAKSVAKYLEAQGIDPSRFVLVGNGITKPVADNSTPEGMAENRRTDIYFKIIE